MKTIHPYVSLKKIEFQSDLQEVVLNCTIHEADVQFDTSYLVSQSELNQIIGEIQQGNEEINVYDLIDQHVLSANLSLYTLDLEAKNIQNNWLSNTYFTQNHLQIRA